MTKVCPRDLAIYLSKLSVFLILDFNGGSDTVAAHGGPGWNWYQVDVPDTGFIGWDIELIDDSGGDPFVVVRKDLLPGGDVT